jgi:hypothetical protein
MQVGRTIVCDFMKDFCVGLGWLVRGAHGPRVGDRVCDWAESRAARVLGFVAPE